MNLGELSKVSHKGILIVRGKYSLFIGKFLDESSKMSLKEFD